MKQLAVKMGYCNKWCGVHTYGKRDFTTGLGCMRSQVQILSRRPSYPLDISPFCLWKRPNSRVVICAHECSKRHANEGIAGGKIGVRQGHKAYSNLGSLSAPSSEILTHKIQSQNSSSLKTSLVRGDLWREKP